MQPKDEKEDVFFPLWSNLMEGMLPISREDIHDLWDVDSSTGRFGDSPKTKEKALGDD